MLKGGLPVFLACLAAGMLTVPLQADDRNCVDLARTIAHDYLWEVKAVSDRGAFQHSFCGEYKKQSDKSLGITIPIYGVPVTLSSNESKYLYSTLCDSSSSWFESSGYRESSVRIIDPLALQTIELCLTQDRIGLKVNTQRKRDTLVVSLYYSTPRGLADQSIKITDIGWDDTLECEGTLVMLMNKQTDKDAILSIVLDTEVKTIRCKRKAFLNPPASCNDQALRHAGGTVTIETTAGAVLRDFPAEVRWRTDLTARIEQLQATVDGTTARLDCKGQRNEYNRFAPITDVTCADGYTEVHRTERNAGVFWTVCCEALLERP